MLTFLLNMIGISTHIPQPKPLPQQEPQLKQTSLRVEKVKDGITIEITGKGTLYLSKVKAAQLILKIGEMLELD